MKQGEKAHEAAAPLAIAGAAAVLLLALGALPIAWAEDFVGCLDEDICGDRGLMRTQLMLAIVNVVVAFAVLTFVMRRMRRAAIAAALMFGVSFATWALLNDASTHGWGDLRLLPG